MRTLVTGGAGFIGSHLVEHLVHGGHAVRVLDNFSTGRRANLAGVAGDVELIEGDVQSYERAHAAIKGCEVVFHQAALPSVPRSIEDPLTSNGCNVIGTLNILLAARDAGVRRVVYASSSSVYGASPVLPNREAMRVAPVSPYAVTKLAGEGYCRSFHEVYGLETVALRYFNVFGPRQDPASQYSAVIPNFITAYLAGDRPVIFGDGQQSRDFTFVENVVRANVLAAWADGVSGGVLNIACGTRMSLSELADEVRLLTGSSRHPAHGPARAGEVRHSLADIAAAHEQLGYKVEVDTLDGLERTCSYYRDHATRVSPQAAAKGYTTVDESLPYSLSCVTGTAKG